MHGHGSVVTVFSDVKNFNDWNENMLNENMLPVVLAPATLERFNPDLAMSKASVKQAAVQGIGEVRDSVMAWMDKPSGTLRDNWTGRGWHCGLVIIYPSVSGIRINDQERKEDMTMYETEQCWASWQSLNRDDIVSEVKEQWLGRMNSVTDRRMAHLVQLNILKPASVLDRSIRLRTSMHPVCKLFHPAHKSLVRPFARL